MGPIKQIFTNKKGGPEMKHIQLGSMEGNCQEEFGDTLFAFRFDWRIPKGTPYTLIVREKISGLTFAAINKSTVFAKNSKPDYRPFVECVEAINKMFFNGEYVRVDNIVYPDLDPTSKAAWNSIYGNFRDWHIDNKPIPPKEFKELATIKVFDVAVEKFVNNTHKSRNDSYEMWLYSLLDFINNRADGKPNDRELPNVRASEEAEYSVPQFSSLVITTNHIVEQFIPDLASR
jgi:hypothetical protein